MVLEPLAAGALAEGRDVRATRSRSRRSATTATATRCSCACVPRGRPATPARSRASRRRSGGRSPSGRSSGPRARTRPSCSNAGIGACARKVGEEAVEVAVAALDESDERVLEEAADLVFHLYVLLAARGLDPRAGRGRARGARPLAQPCPGEPRLVPGTGHVRSGQLRCQIRVRDVSETGGRGACPFRLRDLQGKSHFVSETSLRRGVGLSDGIRSAAWFRGETSSVTRDAAG